MSEVRNVLIIGGGNLSDLAHLELRKALETLPYPIIMDITSEPIFFPLPSFNSYTPNSIELTGKQKRRNRRKRKR